MKKPVVIGLLVAALLLLLAGIGAVLFFTLRNGLPERGPFSSRDVPSQMQESKTFEIDVQKPVVLNITDDVGNVTVLGADVETVQIEVTKTAYDSTQAKADEKVKTIDYSIRQTGNTILIEYEVPNLNNFSNINSVDFFITVPHKTALNIDNNIGDIDLSEIQGKIDVELDFGTTDLRNITGAVSVTSNGGDIKAESIKANSAEVYLHSDFGNLQLMKSNAKDVTITSNGGSILISEVRASGKVETKTDFGETTIQNGSANSMDVSTNGGNINIEKMKISGALVVKDDFGEIDLDQAAAASYDIKSNGGNINIDGAKGSVKAHTDFGKITVNNGVDATIDLKSNSGEIEFNGSLGEGPHLVKTDFGNISLVIPGDTKLTVNLKTDFGNIESDLPITITTNGSPSNEELTGNINGGGAQLDARTNGGNIRIQTSQ